MMERIPMEVGRVVMSKQGRDRDRCFVILSVVDDQYVHDGRWPDAQAGSSQTEKSKTSARQSP